MNIWPDGGIGNMHKHPWWGHCKHCPAASGCAQRVSEIVVIIVLGGSCMYFVATLLEAWISMH